MLKVSISSSSMIRGLSNVVTDEQKKQEQSVPPPSSEEVIETKPNEELEKLNKEISELTGKNNELLVCVYPFNVPHYYQRDFRINTKGH